MFSTVQHYKGHYYRIDYDVWTDEGVEILAVYPEGKRTNMLPVIERTEAGRRALNTMWPAIERHAYAMIEDIRRGP